MAVLKDIPVRLGLENVRNSLKLKDSAKDPLIRELIEEAMGLITPEAVYKPCMIESKSENGVTIDGQRFTSTVLRRNVDKIERVFPFVVTIGQALEDRAATCGDMLRQYFLEEIGNMALRISRQFTVKQIQARFDLPKTAVMNPGSLSNWSIDEQAPLFKVLANGTGRIGVTLEASFLMHPRKSLSGICFPTDTSYVNCKLCPLENCPARRARFDRKLASDFGLNKNTP